MVMIGKANEKKCCCPKWDGDRVKKDLISSQVLYGLCDDDECKVFMEILAVWWNFIMKFEICLTDLRQFWRL